jgi:predicted metal-dependent enzyme (double-stranded beta helix superfamily)
MRSVGDMFDIDTLIAQCRATLTESDPRAAVRELLLGTVDRPSHVADVLGRDEGGIEVLYSSPEMTVVNVIWAPNMAIYPHDHRMWATIGVYGGVEANTFYRRTDARIEPAGGRVLDTGDVFSLGPDAIHHVANPGRRFTGAIHVYGGDFVNEPRSQWDPDELVEQPFDMTEVQQRFAAANEAWRASAEVQSR